MTDEQIEKLIHSKRNCVQMLQAVDRLLERAQAALEDGNTMRGTELVVAVRDSLPRAIGAIQEIEEPPLNG